MQFFSKSRSEKCDFFEKVAPKNVFFLKKVPPKSVIFQFIFVYLQYKNYSIMEINENKINGENIL